MARTGLQTNRGACCCALCNIQAPMAQEAQLVEIERLLQDATGTLEARWEGLDDEALSAEIAKYRSALTDVSRRLAGLGACGCAGPSDHPCHVPWREGLPAHLLCLAATQQSAPPLLRAGIALDLEADAAAEGSGGGAQGADPLGVEGVDYTLGSVDDLDPSEWQVREIMKEYACEQ